MVCFGPKQFGTLPAFKSKAALAACRAAKLAVVAAGQSSDTFNYSAAELAGEGKAQSFAYRGLTVALGIVGFGLVGNPSGILELAYAASPSDLVSHMIRSLGAFHILSAVVTSTLADAASHARLGSDTYKSLNLGLIAWAACSLTAFFTAPVVPPTTTQAIYGSLLASAVTVPAVCSQGLTVKIPKPKLFPLLSAHAMYDVATTLTLAFGTIVLLYTTNGIGTMPVPQLSWVYATLGAVGVTMLRLLGAASVLSFSVLTTLSDAAKRRRLGASTFKALNLGVAMVSGVLTAVALAAEKAGTVHLAVALPSSLADVITRWPDALSAVSFAAVPLMGLVALYQLVAAKK